MMDWLVGGDSEVMIFGISCGDEIGEMSWMV